MNLKFAWNVAVRFHDLDAMGHAHHTLPIIYFEEARAAYWREVAGQPAVDDINYVIAEMRVQFKQRIMYPASLTVRVSVTHVGNASFTMAYQLNDEEGALLATGESVQVMFDYNAGKARRMPDDVRARIESYEGLSG